MGWYEASGVTMRPHWSTGRTKYLWARVADDGTLWVRMDHIFWSDDPPRYERSSLWTTYSPAKTTKRNPLAKTAPQLGGVVDEKSGPDCSDPIAATQCNNSSSSEVVTPCYR